MLYIFDKVDLLEDDFPGNYISQLSAERLTKVKRLRTTINKKTSAAAYLLLRLALKDVYGITDVVEFDYASKGKPELKGYAHIHFNLSHSHNTVVCAVADIEVGVDVQQIKFVNDKTARRVLTEKEFSGFKNSSEPNEYFCRIWSIKESFVKRSGQGITTELKDISAESLQNIMTLRGKDYFCSVCGPVIQKNQIKYIRREDFEKLSK